LLPPSEIATERVMPPLKLPVCFWFNSNLLIISFTKAYCVPTLHHTGFSGNGQNRGWISMKVNIPEEELVACILQGF